MLGGIFLKTLRNDNNGFTNILIGSLKGLIYALVVFLIIMLIVAFIMVKKDFSDTATEISVLCALGISSLVGSIINTKKLKIKGILAGLLTAAELFVLVLIFSLFGTNGSLTLLTLKKLLVILIPGIFGGVLAANTKKRY